MKSSGVIGLSMKTANPHMKKMTQAIKILQDLSLFSINFSFSMDAYINKASHCHRFYNFSLEDDIRKESIYQI